MAGGERGLTDSIEVLYVHATIKVEGSTEALRETEVVRGEKGMAYFLLDFSTFTRHN